MKPKMIAVSLGCIVVAVLATIGPAVNSYAQNTQKSDDEAKLRSVIATYYDFFQKKDLAGMKSLWSAKSPFRHMLELMPMTEYAFSNIRISHVVVEHESAKLRVSFDLRTVTEAKTAGGQPGSFIGNSKEVTQFFFLREGDQWLILRENSAAVEFAGELIQAKTLADMQKLLDANPELLGRRLCSELTTYANSYLANGDSANALKAFSLVVMVSERTGDDTDIAQTRFMIGFIYVMQGKPNLAVEPFEKALSKYESKSDWEQVTITLYNLGNAYYQQSIYDKARNYFQKSLDLAKQIQSREDAANANVGLALVYRQLKDDNHALECYLAAISDYEAVGNTATLPDIESSAASIYYQKENYLAATEHYKQAAALLDAVKNQANIRPLIANARTNLANSLYQLGDYGQAFDNYQRCLALGKEMQSKEWQAIAEEGIGLVLMMQGSYQNSLDHYFNSLSMNRETANKPGTLRVLSGIGDVYRSENSNALAIGYYKQALVIARELSDKQSTAMLMANSGHAFSAQGLYSIALDYHQQSLSLFQEIRNQAGVANSLGNQGGIYFVQGNYPAALEAFQKSLAILDSIGDSAGSASVLRGIGLVSTAQGNYPVAQESYAKSLKQYESLGKKSDIGIDLVDIGITLSLQRDYKQSLDTELRAAAIASEVGNRDTLWHAQFRAGDAYRHLDQIPQARQSFEDAIKTIEEMHRQVTSNAEASMAATNKCAPYLAMVDLLIGQNKTNEALAYAERAKSQALLDLLAQSGINIDKGLTAQQRDQEANLKGELISLSTQIFRGKQGKQPDQARLDGLEKLRAQRQIEFSQFESKLNTSNPYLRVLRGDQKPLRPDEVNRLLPDTSTVLLDYVVAEANTYLFIISRTPGAAIPRIEVCVVNAGKQALADKVNSFRSAIENRQDTATVLGQELFAALVNPAKDRLQGKSSIVIVPDDSLWYLPFQALLSNENRFVIEDFDVSYAPSLTALDEMKKLRNRNSVPGKLRLNLLAAGDPVISDEAKDRINLFEPGRNLAPRSEEQRQLKEMGTLYATAQSRFLMQADAKELLVKAEVGKYRFLHFTAIGTINDVSPLHSYVALAKGDTVDNQDGLMEAKEILALDMKPDLAILSGSRVIGSQSSSGQGLLGLSWAFFVGGCPDILISESQADLPGSTELMLSFHKKLKSEIAAGRSEAISKSWRDAVLQILKNPDYRHPSNWAGFNLVGAQK